MKFSEAIRLGAMLKPQGRGAFLRIHEAVVFGDVFGLRYAIKTCAVGAALDAVGALREFHQNYEGESDNELVRRWPIVNSIVDPPVQNAPRRVSLARAIVGLNDQERWTREQIAEWVATVEAQAETPQIEEVGCIPG